MDDFKFGEPEVVEAFSDALLAEGFIRALIGFGTQFNRAVAIYDWNKCVEILVERDQMSYEDAVEFMDFNVTGAYVGEHTPVFLRMRGQLVESIQ